MRKSPNSAIIGICYRFHYLSNASYSLTLKELHLEIVDASDALAINKFKNLTTLSLGCCWQLSDDHLSRFKVG